MRRHHKSIRRRSPPILYPLSQSQALFLAVYCIHFNSRPNPSQTQTHKEALAAS